MLMFCDSKKEQISSEVPTAIVFVNRQPTLDRTILGLNRSVLGLAIKTASKQAASAVRSMAPIFPGFSIPSNTNTNGVVVEKVTCLRLKSFVFTTARFPGRLS